MMGLVSTYDLREVRTRTGRLSLLDLLDGWARCLSIVHEQLSWQTVDSRTWGIHDWEGTLNTRQSIHEVLQREAGDVETPTIVTLDRFLRSFTEDRFEVTLLPRFGQQMDQEPVETEWWWKRVPTSGAIRDDYFAAAARLKGQADSSP